MPEANKVQVANFPQRLRKLIGRRCEYLGRTCRLVEILDDEGTLVLEALERVPPIQTDQYGQAIFRGNELVNIPIFGEDPDQFSEEVMDLFSALTTEHEDHDCSQQNNLSDGSTEPRRKGG